MLDPLYGPRNNTTVPTLHDSFLGPVVCVLSGSSHVAWPYKHFLYNNASGCLHPGGKLTKQSTNETGCFSNSGIRVGPPCKSKKLTS